MQFPFDSSERLAIRPGSGDLRFSTAFLIIAASPFVGPLLFQVSATDPPIYALVAVTLLLVAGIAGSLPAWRATRVDPREALQAD